MKIFCSYSHKDRKLKERLEEHLAVLVNAGKISTFWSDDEITTGTEFDPKIRREIDEAGIILLLLSASYCKSVYCWNIEARIALERDENGQAKVIPILMRAGGLAGDTNPKVLSYSPRSSASDEQGEHR